MLPIGLRDVAPRHRRVLLELAEGSSNKEIAASSGLKESTVRQYVSELLVQFVAESRTQLALRVHHSDLLARLKALFPRNSA